MAEVAPALGSAASLSDGLHLAWSPLKRLKLTTDDYVVYSYLARLR